MAVGQLKGELGEGWAELNSHPIQLPLCCSEETISMRKHRQAMADGARLSLIRKIPQTKFGRLRHAIQNDPRVRQSESTDRLDANAAGLGRNFASRQVARAVWWRSSFSASASFNNGFCASYACRARCRSPLLGTLRFPHAPVPVPLPPSFHSHSLPFSFLMMNAHS
jgi:hypothetical protein